MQRMFPAPSYSYSALISPSILSCVPFHGLPSPTTYIPTLRCHMPCVVMRAYSKRHQMPDLPETKDSL